jgi:hypothetical protein
LSSYSSFNVLLIAVIMFDSARHWFRRNRTNFAVGAGLLGAGYLAAQYVLGKVTETRQQMSDERIAKEKWVAVPVFTAVA